MAFLKTFFCLCKPLQEPSAQFGEKDGFLLSIIVIIFIVGKKHTHKKMGTVLSFSPREKTPSSFSMEYNNLKGNGNNYQYCDYRSSKENILSHNNNSNGSAILSSASKAIIEKGMKKHNMFLNALSWKRFTSNTTAAAPSNSSSSGRRKSHDKKSNPGASSHYEKENHVNNQIPNGGRNPYNKNVVGQFSRQPLDNVHPYIENQKNIQVLGLSL